MLKEKAIHNLLRILLLCSFYIPSISGATTSARSSEAPGCVRAAGAVLGERSEFGYTHLTCRDHELITFEKFIGPIKIRNIQVIDELRLPKPRRGYELIPHLFCSSSAYKSDPIIALGRWKKVIDGYEVKNIQQAWRFNLRMGQIDKIPPHTVDCSSDDP
ncbi:MAG TPA: hypothetical protein VGU61_05720 [Noviherbaspirillum sp.]|jgi:hypothetical protein|uniref:hypothetical protein n=1 Tax=Noviherbaspirillum sp. TaxID=1926288 RepID=UPI002DDD5AF0|nr:hypothetical protein [Noviherbaspirillum sp.]HEV2609746.1 hypothetical protein [Noviherbaspirillum sp.]